MRSSAIEDAVKMTLKSMVAIAALSVLPSATFAEDCKQYPPGPFRHSCMIKNRPGLANNVERCKAEAAKMNLTNAKGHPEMREYVQGCMRRH